jgi:hypothetical protein
MTIGNRTQSTGRPIGQIPWASSSIGNETHVTIEALQKGLTVDLIATKRSNFETCAHDEMLSTVVQRNRNNRFDFLPAVEPATGRIVGLIEIAPLISPQDFSSSPRARSLGTASDDFCHRCPFAARGWRWRSVFEEATRATTTTPPLPNPPPQGGREQNESAAPVAAYIECAC